MATATQQVVNTLQPVIVAAIKTTQTDADVAMSAQVAELSAQLGIVSQKLDEVLKKLNEPKTKKAKEAPVLGPDGKPLKEISKTDNNAFKELYTSSAEFRAEFTVQSIIDAETAKAKTKKQSSPESLLTAIAVTTYNHIITLSNSGNKELFDKMHARCEDERKKRKQLIESIKESAEKKTELDADTSKD